MQKKLFICSLLIFILLPCFSLEWPSESQKFSLLFGQKNPMCMSFSKGIVFQQVKTVRASEHGKHLINIEEGNSRFPSTLGNAVIFIHEDGLQTIYGNLKNTNLFSSRTKTETGSVIGQTGNSAWGENEALIFQVVDTKNQVFINPLLLLPQVEDESAPTIESVVLTDKNNRKISLGNTGIIKQGAYNLYANIYDMVNKKKDAGVKVSPFRVTVLINGINVINVPFEVLKTDFQKSFFQGTEISAQDLYKQNDTMHFGVLNLTSGKVDLTINARDITGNEIEKTFSFIVK